MNDFIIDGVASVNGGEFGKISIDGVGKCSGNIKAETVEIDGIFTCDGSIAAQRIKCDGKAEVYSNIKAKELNVDGMLRVMGSEGKIEADEITCDGYISADMEINADKIVVNGHLRAREIVGDSVSIKTSASKLSRFIRRKFSEIDAIEATEIVLAGVIASNVSGENISIGPLCEVENLECSGTLFIDEDANVNNISGDYTMSNG